MLEPGFKSKPVLLVTIWLANGIMTLFLAQRESFSYKKEILTHQHLLNNWYVWMYINNLDLRTWKHFSEYIIYRDFFFPLPLLRLFTQGLFYPVGWLWCISFLRVAFSQVSIRVFMLYSLFTYQWMSWLG